MKEPKMPILIDYSVGYDREIDWYYNPDNIGNDRLFDMMQDHIIRYRPEVNFLDLVNMLFKQLDFINLHKSTFEYVLGHLRGLQVVGYQKETLYSLIILWIGTGDARENAIGKRLKADIEAVEGSTPEKTIAGNRFDSTITRGALMEKNGELEQKNKELEQKLKDQQAVNEEIKIQLITTQKPTTPFSDYSVREHVLIFNYFLDANKINEGKKNYNYNTIAQFIILIFGVAMPSNIFGSDYYKRVKDGEPDISQNLIDSKIKICLLFKKVGMKSIVEKINADIDSNQADLNITMSGNKVSNK